MKQQYRCLCLILSVSLVKSREAPSTSTWCPGMDVLHKDPKDIENDLKQWKIIPDLLDEAPMLPMQVEWYGGPEALFGNEINSTVTKTEPFWTGWNANVTDFYTMILTGLDEKSKENTLHREKQHWIIGNIKEYDFAKGEYLTEYMGPKPLEGKGYFRYVFLAYWQPHKIEFNETKITSTQNNHLRSNFSSKAFAEKYDLGKPTAVNFFRTRHIVGS
ncbi:protein D2 [Bemisia tabaci]|uniref:protein D2 n=1 Tax=Bemisia tabaci TaxID=7038 RepID=UPI003B27BA09